MKFTIRLFFARNLDALIDLADEYIFHGKLEKIIEVTYSYREIDEGCYLNETLFEEYLGLKYPEYSVEKLCLKYKFRIGIQILQIESLIKKSKKILVFSRQQGLRKTLFIEALEYIKVVLEISQIGADFELEKALGERVLSEEKTKVITSEIEEREKFLFGEKIIDNPKDLYNGLKYITNKLHELGESIDNYDKKYIGKLLQIPDSKLLSNAVLKVSKIHNKENLDIPEFLDKEISRSDYRKIFDNACILYGLPQRTIVTSAGSIYDGDNYLEIPRNKKYASLKFIQVLQLICHEIESHYINIFNHKILIGKFRGSHNLPKEEGLAMFMEKIFVGETINDIDSTTSRFINIFIAEMNDSKNYMLCKNILSGKKFTKEQLYNSVFRTKRNYSNFYRGSQHKDIVYTRGLDYTINYLKNGGEFYKLFLGKVGFHDIEIADLLFNQSKNKDSIVFPIFYADLIVFYISKCIDNRTYKLDSSEFYMYIKKKYWFLDIEKFKLIHQIDSKKKIILSNLKQIKKIIL